MNRKLLRPMQLAMLLFTLLFQQALFAQAKIASVKVNQNIPFQKITGFGGFVNSPQFQYNHMSAAEIQQVWGANSPIGSNIMRIYIPTGESSWGQVIQTAQLAKSLGLKIFASPWSMPTEWKTVNIIGSQYDDAGVKRDVYLKPEHYADYAQYLNNFVVLLRNNGVELDAISIQNEPDWKADYAGCIWTPAQLTKFLKENSDVISCPVMAPETIGMSDGYANALLAPDVLPKFEIYGGHQYGGIGTTFKNLQAQGKELWMSEFLINWNESGGTARDFNWAIDAFSFVNSVNNALLANTNAWIHYAAKRYYGFIGDGQFGTTNGVITKRGRIFSQYAKYVTGSTRVQHTFNDNTGSLSGSAYLSQTGDSVIVVVINPSANSYNLSVDLPFLSTSGKSVRTTATEDLTVNALGFAETNRPSVSINPSSVTTLVFKKSGDYTPSQMVSEVVNYKKIETQIPTNAAFGSAYMLSGKTASFSNGSRLVSNNTTAGNGYLALDAVYNRLVFSVETLTSTLNFSSSNTTLNYINAAGVFKSYNYGTVNFDKRANFDWVLDISPNVLTDTCKGIVSITNGNFSSILTFKFKNVFFALGTERGQSFSGPYSVYDGNLLDGLADTTYTSYNFSNVTDIPMQTDWYSTSVNKNSIFYTSAGILSNGTNVVSGTTNNSLTLSDMGGDFYTPVAFTANSATYQCTLNGYKMLTLPFAAAIPDGVKAYTLSFSGSEINGTRITNNIIPANTPVLVNGSGLFTFTGSGNILPLLNPRTGIATSVYIKVKAPVNSYYLTTINGTTSFMKATTSVQPLVNSFGAYLSPAATASNLPIVLDDGAAVSIPMIAVSATSLNKLGYVVTVGTPIIDSFTVSGITLSQDVVITAPANFEVSLSAGSGYATSLSLTPTSGALAPTTIYVRMVAGQTVNAYGGNIGIASTGAESKNITLNGTVYAHAVVNTSETAISGLGYNITYGAVPSRVKSFLVSGSPLAGDITITAPANFEVSRSAASGFGANLTLAIANGKVDTTIIYARLKESLAESTYAGNIVIASLASSDKQIALSGTVTSGRIYDFTNDVPAIAATTPPAGGITVASGNSATAGVVSYTDANGKISNRFRAYSGGNRNGTGVMDLGLFPNNATDYAVTWKQSIGTITDYKVGVLLRGSGLAGTNASTGYVQGIANGYVFIVYNAGSNRSEFRIYRSTTATSLNTLVNTTVASFIPTVGQSVWYRASATGTSPVSLKLEYSTDSINWNNGAVATDASANVFTSGSTQLVWGLASPGFNFFMDDISHKAFSKIKLTSSTELTYDGQSHGGSGFAYGIAGESEVLTPELSFIYKDAIGNVLPGAPVAAGTYKVIASFGGNSLYLPAKDSAMLTILPKALVIKAKDQTKECGGSLALGNTAFEAEGLVGDDLVTSVSLNSSAEGIGSYPITASDAQGTGLTNYSITYVSGTLTVRDVTAPTITSIPQVPVLCYTANGLYTIPKLEAADQCGGAVTVRYAISGATTRNGDGVDASGNFGIGISTISWVVSDGQGNEVIASTTVTVNSPLTVNIPDVFAVNSSVDQANTLYIGYGPTSLQLQAIANGGTAPYRYDWSTAQTGQTVSISTPGTYTVAVSDVNGCTASSSIVIKSVDVSCGNKDDKVMICHHGKTICINAADVQEHLAHGDNLGTCATVSSNKSSDSEVEEVALEQTRIYPNPAQAEITIQLGAEVRHIQQVTILDLSGKTVVQTQVNGQKTMVIPIKQLPSGLYLIQIKGDRLMTYKIIKQ